MGNYKKKQLGIYVHIPFCISKCAYCDFLSGTADDAAKAEYVDALVMEIEKTVNYIDSTHMQSNDSAICEEACENKCKGFCEDGYGDSYENSCENVYEGHRYECHAHEGHVRDNYIVETVFFGGGTPSCMDAVLIGRVMDKLKELFCISKDCEATIECNPGTLTKEKAHLYREHGINRISFGLQSANDMELKMLGRIHTFDQFKESLRTAREAGFDNINVDVMSALPGQTVDGYRDTLKKVIDCDVEHISAYSLIVEEGTVLHDRLETDYPPLPDEDAERQMYYDTESLLGQAGFLHYEISNYAKAGRECRHNLSYWERKDYLGFGVGAASLFEEKRHANIADRAEYVKILLNDDHFPSDKSVNEKVSVQNASGDLTEINKVSQEQNYIPLKIWAGQDELSVDEQMEEYMFLGLRKMAGINMEDFAYTFSKNIEDVYREVIEENIHNGLLKKTGSRLMLTSRGIDVSNVVMSEFLLD